MPAARSNKPNNALPTNPDLRTRLLAAAAVAGTGALVVNGRVR